MKSRTFFSIMQFFFTTQRPFRPHTDRKGLFTKAQAIPGNGRQWFLNHGEVAQAISLAELLHSEFGEKSYVVDRGVVYGV